MLSQDEDFSPHGQKSGIKYDKSFAKYKKMISSNLKDSQSKEHRLYKRIIYKFSIAVFGATPVSSNEFVVDDGKYESELERFNEDAHVESPVESDDDVEVVGAPSQLTSPAPPLQSDRRVSISIASNVSHTIAALSQVLNMISNNITLPPPIQAPL